MTTITIRHVPDEVRNDLAARAARAGQSLQEYMLREVTRLASLPSMDEWLAGVRENKRRGGKQVSTQSILDAIHADRR